MCVIVGERERRHHVPNSDTDKKERIEEFEDDDYEEREGGLEL